MQSTLNEQSRSGFFRGGVSILIGKYVEAAIGPRMRQPAGILLATTLVTHTTGPSTACNRRFTDFDAFVLANATTACAV